MKTSYRFFKKAEGSSRDDDEFHATNGPLAVSSPLDIDEVSLSTVEAGVQSGLPRNPDINGASREGVGIFDLTTRHGRRCSTSIAYLHPIMRRPNLRVRSHAFATRLLFAGRRPVGVEYRRSGPILQAKAHIEVILSGGAVNSPQLLELSAVGHGNILQAFGIKFVHHLPGVGQDLQDHLMVNQSFRVRPGINSANQRSHGLRLLSEVFRYVTRRRGFLALSAAKGYVFCKSQPFLDEPDIQFHFFPATVDLDCVARDHVYRLENTPGLTFSSCQLWPESRGSIHIRSPDPAVPPSIKPNYLDTALDREVSIAGVRWRRQITRQQALHRYVENELTPGQSAESDQQILEYVQSTATSVSHPSGTCRMGIQADAVMDPRLRLHGISGLRVADASIMPRLVSGNTNAPCIMIGEKAAAMIVEESHQALRDAALRSSA